MAAPTSSSQMKVHVKTISGERYTVEVAPEVRQKGHSKVADSQSTVAELKKLLEPLSGLASSRMRIIFQGKALLDTQSLGPDCKIQNDNVVHLVEKAVPAEAQTASGSTNTAQQNPPAPAPTQAGAGPFILHGGAPGTVHGPGMVIRTVQFGFDPSQAQNFGQAIHGAASQAPQPSQTQSGQATPNVVPNTNGQAPNTANPAVAGDFLSQIMQVASHAANWSMQVMQGSQNPIDPNQANTDAGHGTQPGSVLQTASQQSGANPSGPAPAPGTAPAPHPQGARVVIPAYQFSPVYQILNSLGPFEDALLPQFESHIRGLASDIQEHASSSSSNTALPTRRFDINIPSPGVNRPPIDATVTANTTAQSLWKRILTVQRRWLAIIQAIEGDVSSYGTIESATTATPSPLATPQVAATSSAATGGLPQLVIPPLHPLRHQLEHWAPQVTSQIGALLWQVSPLLSQHHLVTHHQAHQHHPHTHPTQPQGPHAHDHPATTMTNSTPPQASSPTSQPTASTSTAPQGTSAPNTPANHMTPQAQAAFNRVLGAANRQALLAQEQAQVAQLEAQRALAQAQLAQLQALQAQQAQSVQQSRPTASPVPPTNSTTPTSSSTSSPATVPSTNSPAPSTQVAPERGTTPAETSSIPISAATPSATPANEIKTLSDDEFMGQWDSITSRDEARQAKQKRQRPFSDAYACHDAPSKPSSSSSSASTSSVVRSQVRHIHPNPETPTTDAALLSSMLREAETALPGSSTSSAPLSSNTLPETLLENFRTILSREITTRLENDPDWAAIRSAEAASGNPSRYPNLERLMDSKPKSK